ncbi:FUSC family protein [Sphingomonas sp. 1P08PE]|uniref:FUSC family protein n=1 Tax=Sphingomonas sp. 1P08PE TaxID=554122 RepID=UPI0039A21B34
MNSRILDEAECVASVLLSITVAHLVGANNVAWAAFAGLLVMRGHAADTLQRGLLRMVGTVAGGATAFLLVPVLTGGAALGATGLLVVGTLTIYTALTVRHAYAWLISGLTFLMVMLDKIEHPQAELADFVQTRLLENVTGTGVCMLVSVASTLTLRRWWPAIRTPAPTPLGWHRDAFRHALQGGIALALLVLLAYRLPVPALAQGAIAIVAVMLVPASELRKSTLSPVTIRLFYRLIGCAAGGAFAGLFVFVASGSAAILMVGTALGVIVGRHWETGDHAHRYAGTQFTFAVLITLVPDSFMEASIVPGWQRLVAVFTGMALIEPVLITFHAINRLARRTSVGGRRQESPDPGSCSLRRVDAPHLLGRQVAAHQEECRKPHERPPTSSGTQNVSPAA